MILYYIHRLVVTPARKPKLSTRIRAARFDPAYC